MGSVICVVKKNAFFSYTYTHNKLDFAFCIDRFFPSTEYISILHTLSTHSVILNLADDDRKIKKKLRSTENKIKIKGIVR